MGPEISNISFADVVHHSLSFSKEDQAHALILDLIDSKWFQRLRDISQTGNTKLVYMFSEHSRFGHSIGVAFLALSLMEKLSRHFPKQIEEYRSAVAAAALLHDIGHLAPGSHAAQRIWFPGLKDSHEQLSIKIIENDSELQEIFAKYDSGLAAQVVLILQEDPQIPPWTWEIVSGGGWNVDRGNWCIVDSIMAGVSYGKYNIPALTDSIVLTNDQHLALKENRLDAMMHFAVSRQAMYRQVYQHRVLLACDTIGKAIVKRLRDLSGSVNYVDQQMQAALSAQNASQLDADTVFGMRESWWRYHLSKWVGDSDSILADLSNRLLYRRLFKTLRIRDNDDEETLTAQAEEAVKNTGFDPRYYLHKISTIDVNAGDCERSMLVMMDDGRIMPFQESDPLYDALLNESKSSTKAWLALPLEAKEVLGRAR